jgi:hypothetical protein
MPHFVSHADNCWKVVKEECKVLLRSVIRRAQSIALLAALARGGRGGRVLNEIASYFGKWIT